MLVIYGECSAGLCGAARPIDSQLDDQGFGVCFVLRDMGLAIDDQECVCTRDDYSASDLLGTGWPPLPRRAAAETVLGDLEVHFLSSSAQRGHGVASTTGIYLDLLTVQRAFAQKVSQEALGLEYGALLVVG